MTVSVTNEGIALHVSVETYEEFVEQFNNLITLKTTDCYIGLYDKSICHASIMVRIIKGRIDYIDANNCQVYAQANHVMHYISMEKHILAFSVKLKRGYRHVAMFKFE